MRPSYFHFISGSRFNTQSISDNFENIRYSGIKFDAIGMDSTVVTLAGVKKYIDNVAYDKWQDHVFFIQGHGCVHNDAHYIELSSSELVRSSEIINEIASKFNRPVHIILSSCYSGRANADALKRHSSMLTTTTAFQTGLVEDSAKLLTSFAVLYRFGFTTEQIMLLMIPAYLTDHALTNTSNPVLHINRGNSVYKIDTSLMRTHLPLYEYANRSAFFRAIKNNYNYGVHNYNIALNNYFANPIINKFYIGLEDAAKDTNTEILANVSLFHMLLAYTTKSFDPSIGMRALMVSSLKNSYIGALLINTTYTSSFTVIKKFVKPLHDRHNNQTLSKENIFTSCLRHLCRVINFRISYFQEIFEFANSCNANTGLCQLIDLYKDKINQIEIEKTPLLIWFLQKKNYTGVTQMFGFKEVDPNIIDYSGSNILHYCEDLHLFKTALIHGANPHHRNSAGLTAFEVVSNTSRRHFLNNKEISALIQSSKPVSEGVEKKQKMTQFTQEDFNNILFEPHTLNTERRFS